MRDTKGRFYCIQLLANTSCCDTRLGLGLDDGSVEAPQVWETKFANNVIREVCEVNRAMSEATRNMRQKSRGWGEQQEATE